MKKRINNFRLFESFNYGTWISCEEQLPEDGQMVIVYRGNPDHTGDDSTIFVAEFLSSNVSSKNPYEWFENPSTYFGREITHWMPLPEKP